MIFILADDLTSAFDAAAPFAARGLAVRVVPDATQVAELRADVVAIDLDSRYQASADAEERFQHAAARVPAGALLVKTIDSTLRGHPGPELRGVLRGSGRDHAIVAPAFPAAGRTTVGGRQYVNGVPLEYTSFAQGSQGAITSSVAERLAGLDAHEFTVVDASQDQALDALIARTSRAPSIVWVGSPGLAAALARAVPRNDPARSPSFLPQQTPARTLVVVGSVHEANLEQLDCLASNGARVVQLGRGCEFGTREEDEEALRRSVVTAGVVALVSPREVTDGTEGAATQMAERLAHLVAAVESEIDAVVLTGGHTARRVVDALHASHMDVAGEVEPGVPFGSLVTSRRRVPFAAKAGGFGSRRTLLLCVNVLRRSFEDRLR